MTTAHAAPGPDFIVIGFGKCGSTSLCSMLGEHPGICMSTPKETNYFVWEYGRGPGWYQACFRELRPGQVQGEGSIFYSNVACEGEAAPRIHAANPQVKLIWIARHPIKRLESNYREIHHSGHLYGYEAPYSIGDYVTDNAYTLDDTRYFRRLAHYLNYFPAEQFHVLFLEDLVANREGELARISAFLGLQPWSSVRPAEDCWLNNGNEKLYDSRLLRWARRTRGLRSLLQKAGGPRVDAVGRRMGLRRPFRGPIQWRPGERERVVDELRDDALDLLQFAGKPADFWDLDATTPVPRQAA